MIEKVYDYMKKTGMSDNTKTIVAGLSGGADSVCLVMVLKRIIEIHRLGINIVTVHVNHGIRGEEAERDEKFAKEFAQANGLEFQSYHVNIPMIAKNGNMSEEEAGRQERYRIFREEAKCYPDAKIAVAHHMDDQAETVLMHLMRGTGLAGLVGMNPVNGDIIRPLLCVTRQDIEDFLEKEGQGFITDSTNLDDDYTRNKVRNILIPLMKDIFNPNVTQSLCAASLDAAKIESHIEKETCQAIDEYVVYGKEDAVIEHLEEFLKLDICIRERVYRNVLFRLSGKHKNIYRVNIEAVDGIACGDTGKVHDMPWSLCVKKIYDRLIFERKNSCDAATDDFLIKINKNEIDYSGVKKEYPVGKNIYLNGKNVYLNSINFQMVNNLNGKFSGNDYTKYFDYDKIENTIHIRFRQNGDYFIFSSDGGRKKLKNELIDRKVEPQNRDKVLIVAQKSEVLWAAGIRRCQSYLIDDTTKHILEMTLNFQEE